MQQIPMIVKAKTPVAAFHYTLVEAEPEPTPAPRTDLTVPCAYCGKLTAPALQATPPWYWPGKGMVTNCERCAGGPDGEDVIPDLKPGEVTHFHEVGECELCNVPPCGPSIPRPWPPIPGSNHPTHPPTKLPAWAALIKKLLNW